MIHQSDESWLELAFRSACESCAASRTASGGSASRAVAERKDRYALSSSPPPLRQLERTHNSLHIMSGSSMHWTDQRERERERERVRERVRERERYIER